MSFESGFELSRLEVFFSSFNFQIAKTNYFYAVLNISLEGLVMKFSNKKNFFNIF